MEDWYNVDRHESIEWVFDARGNKTPVLVAGGCDGAKAGQAVGEEYAWFDAIVALGQHFLSRPDVVARTNLGLAVNAYDSKKFYTRKIEQGYIGYPTIVLRYRANGELSVVCLYISFAALGEMSWYDSVFHTTRMGLLPSLLHYASAARESHVCSAVRW